MVKYKSIIFITLIFLFLFFSFSPTLFELSQSNKLADKNREFILEHNYYWPDFNLYLSKIRQGFEGRLTALERYTSESHSGSLIQEFYVILGLVGRFLNLDPNFSYQLGRLILSPLLLIMIILLVKFYFKSFLWQILAFLIVVTSGSFPRFFTDSEGITHVGRFMEWWSNIDALQRITFIPHILFGQVVSFFLLYQLTTHSTSTSLSASSQLTTKKLILLIFLGNAVGLVFPPSLITLNSVVLLILVIKLIKQPKIPILKDTNSMPPINRSSLGGDTSRDAFTWVKGDYRNLRKLEVSEKFGIEAAFIIFTLPSLFYLFFITKTLPWSALVDFHRTHPMMIPLDQYVLGTGPIIFLGFFGAVISIIKRDKKWQPLIFWVLATFSFASLFSVIKDQSPLRFTQTGLFIPLGLLGSYLFYQLYQIRPIRLISLIGITFYLFLNLFMMKVSFNWQTTFIKQRVGANIPPVPYPPQTMYPLKAWMDGIRWLRDNTNHDDVVLAEITAGNFIPAYAGNTVYFGQSNTVDYNRKQLEVDKFFSGKMKPDEAKNFLQNGKIKYIFLSVQEREKTGGENLNQLYPILQYVYTNSITTIYSLD